MVALSHLWNDLLWWQGIYAVFGFFVVSGYLMTLIVNEVYVGFKATAQYLLNRILRIFPAYWIATILTVGLISIGLSNTVVNDGRSVAFASVPRDPLSFLGNVLLVFPWDTKLAISQAWSLRVELIFYALIPLLARYIWMTFAWLAVSLIVVIVMSAKSATFLEQFGTLHGASIAFVAGACIYHLRKYHRLEKKHIVFAGLIFSLHTVFASKIWGFPVEAVGIKMLFARENYGLYCNLTLIAYLVWSLVSIDLQSIKSSKFCKTDRQLGNLAYGIYLLHWVATIIVMSFGIEYSNKAVFVPTAMIVVHLLAFVVFKFIEEPVDTHIRERIRPKS